MEHKSTQSRQLKLIVGKANNFHPTIKFKAKMSQIEITIKMGQHIYHYKGHVFPKWENTYPLVICVSQVEEHISLGICVSQVGNTHHYGYVFPRWGNTYH